jgi:hypothetical protein
MTLLMKKVERNKADCLIIAERANQLVGDLVEALGDQKEADIDPCLKKDLDCFQE